MTRRTFLQQAGTAGLGLAWAPFALLPSRGASLATPPDLGRIAYQLSFIKNFQFAGEYIAEYRKYYEQFGLQVDLLPGGPGATVDPMLVAGTVLIGQSSPDRTATAINRGAPLKIVGANYQKCLFCMISLAKSPLNTPQDMIGKKIGIQVGNLVSWHAFLKLNKINPASLNTVSVQFDMSPLIAGEVDGMFGYKNDELVAVEATGTKAHYFLWADYGYKMLNATYAVRTDALTDTRKRAQLVAFMKGEALGWRDALADPDLATRLTIELYGKSNGLDPANEKRSCIITNNFMVNDVTAQHGLFWMSPTAVQETITTLAAAGVKATPNMFTNELLEEAYEKNT